MTNSERNAHIAMGTAILFATGLAFTSAEDGAWAAIVAMELSVGFLTIKLLNLLPDTVAMIFAAIPFATVAVGLGALLLVSMEPSAVALAGVVGLSSIALALKPSPAAAPKVSTERVLSH